MEKNSCHKQGLNHHHHLPPLTLPSPSSPPSPHTTSHVAPCVTFLILCSPCNDGQRAALGSNSASQRRLRSWWRHEQQSIAAALPAATHHSAQQNGAPRSQRTATRPREAGSETYYAPRGPKTPPPGTRPAPPSEVAELLGPAATVRYVAAGAPLLAVSSHRGAEGVDDIAVKYLLLVELMKKKEQERRRGGECWRRRRRRRSTRRKCWSSDAVSGAASRSARLRTLHGGKRSASLLNLRGGRGKRGGRRSFLELCVCCTSRYAPFFRRHAQDAGHLGWYGPEGQFSLRSSSTPAVACAWLVLLVVFSSRCVPFCSQQADAPHHGRYALEGLL